MNIHQQTSAETVFVAKLRQTIALDSGRIKQIFDIVNLPGLQAICVSDIDSEGGEFEPISQIYVLPNGAEFDNADDALLAWDDLKDELALLDVIAEALLRHKHGMIRPLWQDRPPEQKAVFIASARQFKALADSLGLTITKRMRQ
jgi:hypothetical protein